MEKGMANKVTSEKFGIPRHKVSTSMKNKNKRLQSFQKISLNTKKLLSERQSF